MNVKIGPLVVDHADYDSEGDVLYLHVAGVSWPAVPRGVDAVLGLRFPLWEIPL